MSLLVCLLFDSFLLETVASLFHHVLRSSTYSALRLLTLIWLLDYSDTPWMAFSRSQGKSVIERLNCTVTSAADVVLQSKVKNVSSVSLDLEQFLIRIEKEK